jgi:FkbM family methyltransferase
MSPVSSITLHDQLEALLVEGVDGASDRERHSFDGCAHPYGDTLVLYGAGGLGRRTLSGLRRHGVEPVAFADGNAAMWNREVEGVPVLSPEQAARRYGTSAVFVVTVWGALTKDRMHDRIHRLRRLGCERVMSFGPLYWKYPEHLLPHYGADLPHKVHEQADAVREAFALLADDDSRREYINQIRWRLLLDFDALAAPVDHAIYFPQDLHPLSSEEVFVDCGAFDGDTVRLFLQESGGNYRKILAFEPDPANALKLQENCGRIPRTGNQEVVVWPAATGARAERLRLVAEGTKSSALGDGTPGDHHVEVDCVALDDVLGDPAPTYIKMDIEGAELDALQGAGRTIQAQTPVLAVCCYHRQDHLWKIPLLIRSLNPNYRFYLRPHDLEMWDLVCYAVPGQRS